MAEMRNESVGMRNFEEENEQTGRKVEETDR